MTAVRGTKSTKYRICRKKGNGFAQSNVEISTEHVNFEN